MVITLDSGHLDLGARLRHVDLHGQRAAEHRGHHEEDQQQEGDVHHRRHVDADAHALALARPQRGLLAACGFCSPRLRDACHRSSGPRSSACRRAWPPCRRWPVSLRSVIRLKRSVFDSASASIRSAIGAEGRVLVALDHDHRGRVLAAPGRRWRSRGPPRRPVLRLSAGSRSEM